MELLILITGKGVIGMENYVQEKLRGIACVNRLQMSESDFVDRLKFYIEIEVAKQPLADNCFLGFLLDVANFAYEKEEDRTNKTACPCYSRIQKQCPSCVNANLINIPTCPKCGYVEKKD